MLSRTRDALLRWYFRTAAHRGKARLVRWLARRVVPDVGVVAVAPPGVRLHLHPRDWIEYLLLRGEAYEPLTMAFLAANLRPGDAAVLAGVNFGLHVAVAARAVGPAGVVVGFEPQPAALLRTHANLALNDLAGRVRLVAAAVGDAEEVRAMAWSRPDNAGAASLLDDGPGVYVRLAPLPGVLAAVCPARPRLLLLDVQGYELSVLRGLTPDAAPDLLVVEADPEFLDRAKTTVADLLARFRQLGYEPFHLTGEPVRDGDADFLERNIVGVRPGAEPTWVGRPAAAGAPA